jgi:hypothetical protein
MKFFGIIGFWVGEKETKPGVWKSSIKEISYVGDILKNNRKFVNSENQNDQFTINNQISILSDLYARNNWHSIRYVILNDVKWKVTNVE